MKKLAFILCVMLLPLLLLASANSYRDYLRGIQLPTVNSRGFRIDNSIGYTNEMGTWLEESKTVFHYSSANSWVDSLTSYQYNTDTSAWEEFMTVTYVHDSYGRVSSAEVSISMMGMTFPVMNTIALYDSQHRLIHYYMNSLDFETGLLIPISRMHFSYSATNFSSIYTWEYDSELGVPVYDKTSLSFDAQGRAIETISQTSPDSLTWVNDSRDETTYHPHDTSNAATMIEYFSAILPAAFFSMGEYNILGMPATETSSNWNGTGWVQSDRTVYTYSTNDKVVNTQEDYWIDSWMPSNKTTWSYDSNGNYSEILEQSYSTDTWVNSYKTVYAWEQSSDADDQNTPAANSLALLAYPMPFNGSLTLKPTSTKAGMVKIEIYNVKGQLLNSLATLPGQSIEWNGLDNKGQKTGSGIYFVKANQNGNTTTTRAIKLK
ncbi:MAG: T9SS type A sorting domain-containing protein [Candidatus Cloacimonas sp.]|jgi:hypothetical protein|nr:T9SS type A sorting domain-containing protein [Candidatus Cloacimonas sp.]